MLLTGDPDVRLDGTGPAMVLPVEGSVTLGGESDVLLVLADECLAIDSASRFSVSPGTRLLLAPTHLGSGLIDPEDENSCERDGGEEDVCTSVVACVDTSPVL